MFTRVTSNLVLCSIVLVGKIQTSTNPRHAARPYMVSLAVLRFEVFVRMYACWFSPKATCHASKSSCVNLVLDWPSLWCCKYVKSHSGYFNPLSNITAPKKYPLIKFMVQCSNSAGWKAIKIFICRGKWYVLIIMHTKFAVANYKIEHWFSSYFGPRSVFHFPHVSAILRYIDAHSYRYPTR